MNWWIDETPPFPGDAERAYNNLPDGWILPPEGSINARQQTFRLTMDEFEQYEVGDIFIRYDPMFVGEIIHLEYKWPATIDDLPEVTAIVRLAVHSIFVAVDPANGMAHLTNNPSNAIGIATGEPDKDGNIQVATAGSLTHAAGGLGGVGYTGTSAAVVHISKDFRPQYEDDIKAIAASYNANRHPA